jgi:hypothetical protein
MMQKFYGEEEMKMLTNTGNDLDPLFNGVQNRSLVIITSRIMCVWYCDNCYDCDLKKIIL